jgi:hypothetical protein
MAVANQNCEAVASLRALDAPRYQECFAKSRQAVTRAQALLARLPSGRVGINSPSPELICEICRPISSGK